MSYLTVIKSDKAIYLDGNAVKDCDMSGLPDDFHALQWDGKKGHIEYQDVTKLNVKVSSEADIEAEIKVSVSEFLERRKNAQNE